MATKTTGFTDEEKAAMRERAKELKLSATREAGENALRSKIKEMPEPDKSLATKVHEIVSKAAPELLPKTWYGMPAYTNADGKVVCFFQSADKFKVRYATFGFQPDARLDEGNMWPVAYAVTKITIHEESVITALVKKAAK